MKQKAKQQFRQERRIRGEGGGLICGTPAKRVGLHFSNRYSQRQNQRDSSYISFSLVQWTVLFDVTLGSTLILYLRTDAYKLQNKVVNEMSDLQKSVILCWFTQILSFYLCPLHTPSIFLTRSYDLFDSITNLTPFNTILLIQGYFSTQLSQHWQVMVTHCDMSA